MVPNHARYHLRYTPMQLFHYNDNAHGCQVSFFIFCGEICEICRFLFSEEMFLSVIFRLDSIPESHYNKSTAVSPVLQTLLTTYLEAGLCRPPFFHAERKVDK